MLLFLPPTKIYLKHHEAFYYSILFYYQRSRHRQFILHGRSLCCGNGASHRLDKQSLQDSPASLQVRQDNKTKQQSKNVQLRININLSYQTLYSYYKISENV